MINPRKKSKYWVDDNSILPEIIITPQGNYPILDETGNPARTVGAIQDINPNAHIYERVNTQPFMDDYIEGETNAAANQRADALDAQVVPHMGDFVSVATKPLDALMPSRWVGLLDKDYNGLSVGDRLTRLFDEHNKGLYINDNPAGLFSKRFHDEHPIWAMAGNTAFDVASTPFIWNGANKAYNIGKTAYNTGRNAVRDYNFARALDADIANTNLVIEEPTGAKVITVKPSYYSREIKSPFYKYDENGKPIVFDSENVASLIRLGKQDFINEMLSPEYAEAAIRNMEEAEDMGLHYTPVFEKEGFKSLNLDGIKPRFVKTPESWNASTSLFGGTLGRPSEINYNVLRPFDIRKATSHESGHVSRWGMGETPEEYLYMKHKSSLIFRDDAEVGAYDFKTQTGEGATNMRDLGKDMGITLHTPYPGYEEALRQLNEARETSHKGGIVDILRLDKEHMPYIWRALLGLHWGLVPGIVVTGAAYGASQQDNNLLIQVQKVGGKILPPWHK